MSDDEQPAEILSEESQPQEESNYSDVDSSAGGTDDNLRNFGGAIAVCALLALFGGQTFVWWNVEVELFGKVELGYGTNEVYIDFEGGDDDSYEYDDDDIGYDEVGGFMSNLKIMLYALLICGAALAYMGHSGEKMEFAPKTIAVAASLSVIILIYVFMSLPNAYEEDTELFEALDEDPAYFFSDDGFETTFGLGMLLPLASLGICGYMIKDRGITLEDIKG
tara:strand:- start:572 stop:1237 length:666 start_codon:yes stop_codon:yes gene_type:complete